MKYPSSFCSWDSLAQHDWAMGYITRNWGAILGRSKRILFSIAATPTSEPPAPHPQGYECVELHLHL
jgi:hypothetical protein